MSRSGIDSVGNAKHTVSMELFRKILEDFSDGPFTKKDIKEAYNPLTKDKNVGHCGVRLYGPSHLEYLTNEGLLIQDEDDNSYRINVEGMESLQIAESLGDSADYDDVKNPYY